MLTICSIVNLKIAHDFSFFSYRLLACPYSLRLGAGIDTVFVTHDGSGLYQPVRRIRNAFDEIRN